MRCYPLPGSPVCGRRVCRQAGASVKRAAAAAVVVESGQLCCSGSSLRAGLAARGCKLRNAGGRRRGIRQRRMAVRTAIGRH